MLKATSWSSYQSYKDRKPPWIRLHKSLLDNYEFQSMSDSARALLPMLWLLASEDSDPRSGIITDSVEKISFRLRLSTESISKSLEEIIKAGFFLNDQPCNEFVTEPLQDGNEIVTPETETETEKDLFEKPENLEKEKPEDLFYQTKKGRKLKGDQLENFEAFWITFNYKSGKADAADAWFDLKVNMFLFQQIMAGARREAKGRAGLIAQKKTPKMAQGWLSSRRFEDESTQTADGEIKSWWETASGIEAKGEELGIEQGDDDYPTWYGKIKQAAKGK